MVVEKDDELRSAARKALQNSGYGVLTARNGEEALSLMDQIRVDAVISDVQLSKISGLDLARQIRENYSDTFVVLATGNTGFSSPTEAISNGAGAFLYKPVNYDELKSLLSYHFSKLVAADSEQTINTFQG